MTNTTKSFSDKHNGVILPYYLRDKVINVGDIIFWEDDVEEMDDAILTIIKNTAKGFGIILGYNENDALCVTSIVEDTDESV